MSLSPIRELGFVFAFPYPLAFSLLWFSNLFWQRRGKEGYGRGNRMEKQERYLLWPWHIYPQRTTSPRQRSLSHMLTPEVIEVF